MLPFRFENSHAVYQLDHFALDYRAEVAAAALLGGDGNKPSLPLEELIFSPLGPNARPYSLDFTTQPFVTPGNPQRPYRRFDTPREGIYDQLPPLLFHPIRSSQSYDPNPDPEQLLEELRQVQKVEEQTRLFFLPFDTELYYLRVLRYQRERKQDQLERDEALIGQFAQAWPIVGLLSPSLAGLFVQMLPFIHQLRGDLRWMSGMLQTFLDVPVTFTTDMRITHPPLDETVLALGHCRLGITAIAGNTLVDTYDGVKLTIGPVPEGRVTEFLPDGSTVVLLEQLKGYFMPAMAEVVTEIEIEHSVAAIDTSHATYLGYNSYL